MGKRTLYVCNRNRHRGEMFGMAIGVALIPGRDLLIKGAANGVLVGLRLRNAPRPAVILGDGPEPREVPRRPGLLMVLKVRFLP
jgi:hypothetical protein